MVSIKTQDVMGAGAPDFTLPVVGPNGLTGQTVTLSSFRDKVVLLEFMEPWCPHCQNMAPIIEQLNGQYGSDVVFISVSGPWNGATADGTAKFILSYGSTWTYVYDSSGTVFSGYGVNSTPTFYVIGTDGSIANTFTGEQSYEALAASLTSALRPNQITVATSTTATTNSPQPQTTTSSQNVTLVVPPRYEYYFGFDMNPGDTAIFSFSVSSWRGSDDVGFTIISSTGTALQAGGTVSKYSGNHTALFPGRYYLRFDNSYSIFTTKTISLSYAIIPPTVRIEEYWWNGNTITGYIRNYDTSTIYTNNAQVSLSGETVGSLEGACGQAPVGPGESCAFSIEVPNGTWTMGTPYMLKLATPSHDYYFPVVAGENSASGIQPQPNLVTFQTVSAQSMTPQSGNQTIFYADYFVRNAYEMIGVIAGGVLLIAAIAGLGAISVATSNIEKKLYEERRTRTRDQRRYVPLLIMVSLAALGIIILSIVLPSLTSFDFVSRIPYLLPGVLVLVLIASVVALLGLTTSILRGRRRNLGGLERSEVEPTISMEPRKPDQTPIQPQQVERRCRYCGAEVNPDRVTCDKCRMPAGYL